ncbi:MAG: type I asparaginase [Bacteroidales bacterium]|nr:type I asparaginase [Bacteroidales bacterium]
MRQSILLIYTGGTIGMKQDPDTLLLKPFDFSQISDEVPEINRFGYTIDTYSFDPVIDSSDAKPEFWARIANVIRDNYDSYDGFVVLHGTDTMAYSASALSFMLEGLRKSVIFTGSQLPIGMLRTDGRENLISAIELAAMKDDNGEPMVPEVCICFENKLFRGNRTTKYNSENFSAFSSPNYPLLADIGIHIRYDRNAIHSFLPEEGEFKVNTAMDTNVAILKIFPGMTESYVDSVLSAKGLRAVVLETFGSGNAPSLPWFLEKIRRCTARGVVIVNVTQCQRGSVNMGTYANGAILEEAGVISGQDITTESALTKLFHLLGCHSDAESVKKGMESPLRGEISLK